MIPNLRGHNNSNGDDMKIIAKAAFSLALAFSLANCSSPSQESKAPVPAAQATSDSKVFVTEQSLPPESYTFIADIEIGSNVRFGYGDANKELAEKARQMGADAVINAETKYYPSAFSWAAPHGKGKAVKLKSKNVVDNIKGKWM